MIRSLFGLLVVIGVLLLPGTVLADPGSPRPEPTPHTQRTALSGRVPAPSGTAVTLKAMDIDVVRFEECATGTTLAGPDDSPETSSFEFVLDGACVSGAEGIFVCWSPDIDDCNLVTADAAMLRAGLISADVPSFSELGGTLRTGLLAPPVKDRVESSVNFNRGPTSGTLPLDDTPFPIHGDGIKAGATLPLDEPADAGQITTSSGAGAGPDQQVADLNQSEQGARYGWLLWTGAALLVAGLALGAALRVRARGR